MSVMITSIITNEIGIGGINFFEIKNQGPYSVVTSTVRFRFFDIHDILVKLAACYNIPLSLNFTEFS